MKAEWEGSVPSEDLCGCPPMSTSRTGLGASVKDTIPLSVLFTVLAFFFFSEHLNYRYVSQKRRRK